MWLAVSYLVVKKPCGWLLQLVVTLTSGRKTTMYLAFTQLTDTDGPKCKTQRERQLIGDIETTVRSASVFHVK